MCSEYKMEMTWRNLGSVSNADPWEDTSTLGLGVEGFLCSEKVYCWATQRQSPGERGWGMPKTHPVHSRSTLRPVAKIHGRRRLRVTWKAPEILGCPAVVFEFYVLGWFCPGKPGMDLFGLPWLTYAVFSISSQCSTGCFWGVSGSHIFANVWVMVFLRFSFWTILWMYYYTNHVSQAAHA